MVLTSTRGNVSFTQRWYCVRSSVPWKVPLPPPLSCTMRQGSACLSSCVCVWFTTPLGKCYINSDLQQRPFKLTAWPQLQSPVSQRFKVFRQDSWYYRTVRPSQLLLTDSGWWLIKFCSFLCRGRIRILDPNNWSLIFRGGKSHTFKRIMHVFIANLNPKILIICLKPHYIN